MGLFDVFKKKKNNPSTDCELPQKTMLWYERFIEDLSDEYDKYFLTVTTTRNSYAPILYEVIDNEVIHSNQMNRELYHKYSEFFEPLMKTPGIHMYKYENGIFAEEKYISHYNVELFNPDACELVIFQEYGMYPVKDERKEVLEQSIKAEKIKDTLVYACYLNDTDKIFKCLEKCSKTQLNKKLDYYGTPLGICAEKNNVEAFKAIVEKGADLNKKSLAISPLNIAFNHSPEIVRYIYDNYREQFDKEALAEGFSLALHTTDIELLDLLKNSGCDMECAGHEFPPLHNYADYNNLVGIQYLADQGINLNVLNEHNQTALDRAKRKNNVEAVELLTKLGGK